MKSEQEVKNSASFISCYGIDLAGTLKKVEKSEERLSPVFEATSNALDAIAYEDDGKERGSITITFRYQAQLDENVPRSLDYIEVEDTGVGLTESDYKRMTRLNDCSKSLLNKGSGRLQFVKFFATTTFDSIFDSDRFESKKARRHCELSATKEFLAENALIRTKEPEEANPEEETGTVVRFLQPLVRDDRNYYEQITIEDLKERFVSHFFLRFSREKNLPTITLVFRIGD